jgi:hypothetical protein
LNIARSERKKTLAIAPPFCLERLDQAPDPIVRQQPELAPTRTGHDPKVAVIEAEQVCRRISLGQHHIETSARPTSPKTGRLTRIAPVPVASPADFTN